MLMKPDRSSLLVIDLQEKLVPAIEDGVRVVANATTLVNAAERLGIPVTVTEHCPDRIGHTVPGLRAAVADGSVISKVHFSGLAEPTLDERFRALGRDRIIVAGTETHVCVLQTTMDIKAAGYRPCLVVDATGTRHGIDKETAIARLRSEGVDVVTTEMVLFEWCERGDTALFQSVLPLIKATNS
ncbi:MAG: isochorismatase family protein [Alphaproteobacteria bacterium]|nr:isochorismatase family protein [Alphaproteobacteria bacterium]